jgi:hypothetical protein
MVPIVISPGWRDSPSGHWQSLWAEQLAGAVRVPQDGVLVDFAPVPYQRQGVRLHVPNDARPFPPAFRELSA